MPYNKEDVTVECSLFYCNNWVDGECNADEQAEECTGDHRCWHRYYLNDVTHKQGDGTIVTVISISHKQESEIIDNSRFYGLSFIDLEPGSPLSILEIYTKGKIYRCLVRAKDFEECIFYPTVDDTIDWYSNSQINLFDVV